MHAAYDKDTGLFTVGVNSKENGITEITLTANDIAELMSLAEREVFYRKDIISELEIRAQTEDDIPWEELAKNEKFIRDVVGEYKDYRSEAQMGWVECLNEAFESVCRDDAWRDYLPNMELEDR